MGAVSGPVSKHLLLGFMVFSYVTKSLKDIADPTWVQSTTAKRDNMAVLMCSVQQETTRNS